MSRYVVVSGAEIRHNGMLFHAGDIITEAEIPTDRLENLKACGALEAAEAVEEPAGRRKSASR